MFAKHLGRLCRCIGANPITNANDTCLGGEEAVLKTVDPYGFAGSNPVCVAINAPVVQLVRTLDC